MKTSAILVACGAVLLAGNAAAERMQYTYNGGDVTKPENYTPNGTPTVGDQILIPEDTDLVITNGTAAWTAIVGLGEEGHLVPLAATSRLVLVVPEKNDSVEFPVPFTAWEYKSYFTDVDVRGELVKRGEGEVTLTATRMTYGDYNTCFSVRTTLVEEGALAFALNNTKAYIRLVSLDVKKGATAYLGARPSAACQTYCMGGFFGEGTITTKSASTCALQVYENAAHPGVFNGKLTGNVYWFVAGGGSQSVLSTDNDYNVQTTIYKGYYGAASFGNGGVASSVGLNSYLWFTSPGAFVEYLGQGESVGKQVVLGQTQGGPVTLSAGPNGGIEFKKIIYPGQKTSYPPHVRLSGSNTTEAAISGTIEENKLGNSVYFSKVGSGAWRFKDSKGRLNCNGFAVREGRLIFDSIAETNAFCSLGVATNLFDGSSGPNWTADAHRTDVFLTLGSTNGQAAVFEYGGTNSQACTTRLIGLDGEGGHFRNDNANTQIRWRGARAISGTPVLTLDGASTKTNELADIADGVGTNGAKIALGVRKEGTGTWKISGDTTFSGDLEVKGGKLIVAAPTTNLYTWFRWTMRGHKPGASSTAGFQIEEFGLYNAANKRVNDGLDFMALSANGWGEMGLNEMALQWPGGVVYGTDGKRGPFGDGVLSELGLIDHKKNYGFFIQPRQFGDIVLSYDGVPTTYLPVIFRLNPVTMGEVRSWDYANLWSAASGTSAWSTLLEGSVDGLHWEYLDENTELDAATLGGTSWMWSFKKEALSYGDATYDHNTHTGGRPIESHSTRTYSVLSGKPVVSVDAGAVLEAEGEVTLAKLKVDANGAGTIRGFKLAESGECDVENLPDGQAVRLPLVLEDCTGSVAEWSVKVDGDEKPAYRLGQSNGRLTVIRPGILLIVR